MKDEIFLTRDEELRAAIEWYREKFPDWADSDCVNMAIRDCEAE